VTEPRTESPPIPEARPPHLPDVLTRIAPGFYAFALVAAIIAWVHIRTWIGNFPIFEVANLATLLVDLVASVVPPLLGAALFLRHPRAHRTMPLLVFGLALLATGQLLETFRASIGSFLQSMSPSDGVQPGPVDVAFVVFKSLLSVFAILYIGAGFAAARRRQSRSVERPLLIWIVALSIVGQVLSLAGLVMIGFEPTPTTVIQIATGSILGLLAALAWAYLLTTSVGGWLAAEAPRLAWGFGAFAVGTLFAVPFIASAVLVIALSASLAISWILAAITAIAWIVLLAAFVLGLPAPPGPTEPTDDRPAETQPGSAAG
jgi:hypothetical protein